jgi:protein TonB
MAYLDQRFSSGRAVSVGAVALVHVAIGYALIVGLANHFMKPPVTEIEAYNVPVDKPPRTLRERDPKHQQERITTTDTVVKTSTDTGPKVDQPPIIPPTTIDDQPPPLTPSLARGVQIRGDRAQWFSTIDYPSVAIREGDEGTVAISVKVDINGRVSSCTVTQSSGHIALDEITCKLYAKRARFTAALGKDGAPVEASYADRIRWQLPAD